MKALIIGAAGFVGGYLIEHLTKDLGWEVAATKLPSETLTAGSATVYDLDLLCPEAIAGVLEAARPDCVFHLAAQSSVALSWQRPALTVDINVKGTVNMLEAVRKCVPAARVLLIGSGEEYGPVAESDCPIGEAHPPRPQNIYAVTKATQNMLGQVYAQAYGLHILQVRAFNHIGPRQLPQFVVADFCRQVARIEAGLQEPVIRTGNLAARRDFTDVRDIVRAYSLLIQKGRAGETYNVGSGTAIAISDLLTMILQQANCPIARERDPARFRPVDVPLVVADTGKLFADTGWKPLIPLSQTVADTLNYWRGQNTSDR